MKQFRMLINAADRTGYIRPEIYGHFSEHLGRCIYEGIYVGEESPIPNIHGIRKDVIEAFREIRMPVLRWPGGCFADEYHWKDGIGEKSARKSIINTNWGFGSEDNSFGTHEFMELCELVGCEPYICGNFGSGTVRELSEWVEYITSDGISPMSELRRQNGRNEPWKLKYLGFGNENWGCGGNMRPEYYTDLYRQYQTFCKNYADNRLFRIACGPCGGDYHWTEMLMQNLTPALTDAISLHYYSVPDWQKKGSATDFTDEEYYTVMDCANKMETLLRMHTQIMERYDPENKIALVVDEWGTWYDPEPDMHPSCLYQQNTMRDALTAALNLNLFNRYSRRVVMANLAQAVNVLQALLLTEGEKLVKTPTYHVYDLFKGHQGGEAVYCFSENENLFEGKQVPMLSSSASVRDGVLTLTAANCSLTDAAEICCDICHFSAKQASARILTQEIHACNDFDAPENVKPEVYAVTLKDGCLHMTLPPCAVIAVTLQ